jgi:hypothetical protein
MSDRDDEMLLQAIARLVVDEGMDYRAAKRKAVQALGLSPRTPLPSNDDVEDAVREHIELFCADTQPGELAALRELALLWMQRLAAYQPHVLGAVWHGTATAWSPVHLVIYADDAKPVLIELMDRGVNVDSGEHTGPDGRSHEVWAWATRVKALGQDAQVVLHVRPTRDIRGALTPDSKGRKPQGSLADVQAAWASLAEQAP